VSYDTEKVKVGGEPITICGIVADFCAETYGIGACVAGQIAGDTAVTGTATSITLAAGDTQADDYYNGMTIKIPTGTGAGQEAVITDYANATNIATVASWSIATPDATSVYTIHDTQASTACFNTRATCQDTPNYNKTTKEYIFAPARSSLPIGETIYPLIDGKIRKAGTSTTAGSGLGKRAVVTVKLKDMPHHDRGIDPYVANRTYTPEEQGTFWGKWLKRNIYYEGRTLKVYYGYIGETFSWSDFEVQEYDITDIAGVNNGYVTLTAKDVLVRTYDRKSQYPAASEGELLAGITDVATSATLSPAGIGNTDYPASGTVSFGKEACAFTRVDDVLTLTRAQWGTDAKSHDAGDTVQICATWDGVPATDNVTDVLYELLVTGAGLPSSYIPTTEWDTEQDLWLSSATVKGILMKPESIEKVIAELSESFMFDIWWDATAQEVKIKALSPEPSGVTINTLSEGQSIKQGSLKIDRVSKERFTEIRVYYNKIDYSDDDKPEKFGSLQIAADVSRAGADRYDGNQVKTITSRWFEAGANAAQLTGRLLARFADTPEYVTFMLDNKDEGKMEMAGRLEIDSWQFQDEFGATEARKFQVLEINEKDIGHDFEVKCLTSSFSGRYGFIMADGSPDYSAATEAQKDAGMWICKADGTFDDGTTGYKII
jgi:hypothetical protein